MNTRMTELYRKALELSGNTGTTHFEFMIFVDEFSKSIVNECAAVANNNFDSGFCPVGDFIKDHFDMIEYESDIELE